ncbi:MAG: hypothetical protein AAF804_08995, partial [Bacteroidota bacterium]
RILHNLADPDYSQKRLLKRQIDYQISQIDKDLYPETRLKYHQEKMATLEKELSQLEAKAKPFHQDSDGLITYFEQMLNEEIRGFEFELEGKQNLRFSFTRSGSSLNIHIQRTDQGLFTDFLPTIWSQGELRSTGFTINKNGAAKSIPEFQAQDILPTMELLAWVILEVLELYGRKEMKIKLI